LLSTALLSTALLSTALACTPFEDGADELDVSFGASSTETSRQGMPAEADALGMVRPASPSADWSCLSRPPLEPPPSAVGATRMVYSLEVVDMLTRRPVADLRARACGLTDLACGQPVTDYLPVRPDGWVDVPLFAGFTGYLEITGPTVLPGVVILSDPLTEDSAPGYPYFTLSAAALNALGAAVNIPLDPMAGVVSIRTFDCQGRTAPGVTLTKAGPGTGWYFVSGLPSALEERTDPEGWGGFANSPPGLAQVDALTAEGISISGVLHLMVRAGWITHSFVQPSRVP
jgi:hypothetical protein